MNKINNEAKLNIVDLYVNKHLNAANIGKIYQVSSETICYHLKKLRIPVRVYEKALTNQQELEVVDLYIDQKLSPRQIAKIYNIGRTTVKATLDRCGIKKRDVAYYTAKVDDNFFDIIDTEDKAYFLGLFFADGWIKPYGIAIQLAEKDKYIIEILKEKIKYTGNIQFRDLKNPNHQNGFGLQITSEKLKAKLIEYGCTPRKSITVEFPMLEIFKNDTLRHFLRGYHCGNGHFSLNKRGGCTFGVCGGVKIIQSYKYILENRFGIEEMGYFLGKTGNYAKIGTSKYSNLEKINNLFYQDASLFITRKKIKLANFLDFRKDLQKIKAA